jgi:hypothetical protein
MEDVGDAWQAEFDRLGSLLRVLRREEPGAQRTAAVESGGLRADLTLRFGGVGYHLVLRRERTVLMRGRTADLAAAAGAAQLWLAGERAGEVARVWPFLGSVALAEAQERGDRREAEWLRLHENHCADPVADRLAAFVALAFHEPRLRALRPYLSVWSLGFSSTAQWPFGGSFPRVGPGTVAGRYVVRSPDGRIHDETDAAGALRLVLAGLGS